MITYPVRCRIVDVDGELFYPGLVKCTPEESVPHIGKEGLAEEVGQDVRITLDDGIVLWGWQCWWVPLEAVETAGVGQ